MKLLEAPESEFDPENHESDSGDRMLEHFSKNLHIFYPFILLVTKY